MESSFSVLPFYFYHPIGEFHSGHKANLPIYLADSIVFVFLLTKRTFVLYRTQAKAETRSFPVRFTPL